MDTEILEEIGLEKDEISAYLALLKLGQSSATKLATETNNYRTNIYRILDGLIARGLVAYVLRNNVKYYVATSPKKILEQYKEKEQRLKKLLPELEKLGDIKREDFKVEVFRGKEGLIAANKYMLREGKDSVVFGDEGNFQKYLPYHLKEALRDMVTNNMHERVLSKESKRGKIWTTKNTQIRYLPDEYLSPSSMSVFSDKIIIFDWNEPFHAILIQSKDMAQSHKSYFEALWKLAKK